MVPSTAYELNIDDTSYDEAKAKIEVMHVSGKDKKLILM